MKLEKLRRREERDPTRRRAAPRRALHVRRYRSNRSRESNATRAARACAAALRTDRLPVRAADRRPASCRRRQRAQRPRKTENRTTFRGRFPAPPVCFGPASMRSRTARCASCGWRCPDQRSAHGVARLLRPRRHRLSRCACCGGARVAPASDSRSTRMLTPRCFASPSCASRCGPPVSDATRAR